MPSGAYIYTFQGWPNSGSNNLSCRFDCSSLTFRTDLHAPPFTGVVTATDQGQRCQGAWDGSYWYVVGPDSKLYRYNPTADTWSAALAGGAAIMTGGTPQAHSCVMASDGRYVWIYDIPADSSQTSGTFRRYDPNADTLTGLTGMPGGNQYFAAKFWLVYDGGDRLYCQFGDGSGNVFYYSIAGNSWTQVAAPPGGFATNVTGSGSCWAGFLQGKLYVLTSAGGNCQAYAYNPSGNTWATLATFGQNSVLAACCPFGEIDDDRIMIFGRDLSTATLIYDLGANAWSAGEVTPFALFGTGMNFAVARRYNPTFTWYLADGTTPLATTQLVGSSAVGGTLTYQAVLKSNVDRAAGVTVAVAADVSSDAPSAVKVSASPTGPWTTSFSTGAITANQAVNVYLQVIPTSGQSAGVLKTLNLVPTAN